MTLLAMDRAITRDILALDRNSVRTKDENGYLHVAVSNISKACVNPYYGREIPEFERLGLNPDRIYQLLRAPEELEKAASTFNGMPLMMVHKPQDARGFAREVVVGTLGNDADFKDPYLRDSLTVWDGEGIEAIETEDTSKQCRQISLGYRYDADMTPGQYNGVKYDGVMRNLRGNHATLVPDGRAGCDVVVGDQALSLIIKDLPNMKKTLSRMGTYANGVLAVSLVPKLAMDTKVDFATVLKGVTAKNYKAELPQIKARLKTAVGANLAQDATLDDVNLLLDKLDPEDPALADEIAAKNRSGEIVEDEEDPETAAFLESMKDKLSPEEHAKLCALLSKKTMATDVDNETEEEKAARLKKEADAKKDLITRPAMDAAIAKAVTASVTAATDATIARLTAARDAERDVRPYIGDLANPPDSAEGFYRMALDSLKVEHKDIKETAALKALVLVHPAPGTASKTPRLAHDAAAAKTFATKFPEIAAVRSI